MLKALTYFIKKQPLALSAFVLALIFLLFFSSRFILNFIYFQDPAHRNQALELWMTPKYVGMSYQLPPHVIDEVMEIGEKGEGKRIKLDEVIARLDISLQELEARVRQAAVEHHAMSEPERKDEREAHRDRKRSEAENNSEKNASGSQ